MHFPRAMERTFNGFEKLGLNAVRTSHNPQASLFYDLCDELGIMVINELYDKWYSDPTILIFGIDTKKTYVPLSNGTEIIPASSYGA